MLNKVPNLSSFLWELSMDCLLCGNSPEDLCLNQKHFSCAQNGVKWKEILKHTQNEKAVSFQGGSVQRLDSEGLKCEKLEPNCVVLQFSKTQHCTTSTGNNTELWICVPLRLAEVTFASSCFGVSFFGWKVEQNIKCSLVPAEYSSYRGLFKYFQFLPEMLVRRPICINDFQLLC